MQTKIWILMLAFTGTLAACGDTAFERGVTGAAGGAVAGEVLADEPVAGAAIGGAAGVLTTP